MNRNDIRPAAIGIASAVATIAALVAWLEYDLGHIVAERVALTKLSPEERAALADIDAAAAARRRAAEAASEKTDALQAQRDARDLAGFAPDLLSTPGSAESPAQLSVMALADEIAHTQNVLDCGYPAYEVADLARHRQHSVALLCEWRHRDGFKARLKLAHHEQLRHRIAAEKVAAARFPHTTLLPTVSPLVEN